jgi:UDP-N-acetylmuramoyl-tripeptide--D-alanyl-D-alanine ligase
VKLARPHVAIITTIAPAHMAHFKDETEIAFAKAEIFEGLEPGGTAILPRDNPHYDRLARRAQRCGVTRILRFGEAVRANARILSYNGGAWGATATAQINGARVLYKLGAPGRHLAVNSLSALLAVQAAGGDLARAAMALGGWTAPDGRGARWIVALQPIHAAAPADPALDGAIELIDESYNANPVSMAAAFEVLAASDPIHGVGRLRRGRRIAILGDMLELGPDEIARHADLAAHPALASVDLVHCVGPRMKALHDALPNAKRGKWRKTSTRMAEDMHRLLDAGDVVMVKGSLGAAMLRVVDAIKRLGAPRPADAVDEAI